MEDHPSPRIHPSTVQGHFSQLDHCGTVAFHSEASIGDQVPLPVQGKHQFLCCDGGEPSYLRGESGCSARTTVGNSQPNTNYQMTFQRKAIYSLPGWWEVFPETNPAQGFWQQPLQLQYLLVPGSFHCLWFYGFKRKFEIYEQLK